MGMAAMDPTSLLPDGFHAYSSTSDSNTFYATFYSESLSLAETVSVFVDGVEHALDLFLGSHVSGTFSTTLPASDECQDYYFVARASTRVGKG